MNPKATRGWLAIWLLAGQVASWPPAAIANPLEAPSSTTPANVSPQVLDELPPEIVHEGTRLFDFRFDAEPGAVLSSGAPLHLSFQYETDRPGKVLVGGLPVNLKGALVGGFQPATLEAEKGTGMVRVFCGAEPATKPIATLTELKESYQPLAKLEIQIYGQVRSPAKVRVPINFLVIPAANFTVHDKFYLDSLVNEIKLLRRRIRELEEKLPQDPHPAPAALVPRNSR